MSNELADILADHGVTDYYELREGGHEMIYVQTIAGGLWTAYRRCEAGYAFERQVGRLPAGARQATRRLKANGKDDRT